MIIENSSFHLSFSFIPWSKKTAFNFEVRPRKLGVWFTGNSFNLYVTKPSGRCIRVSSISESIRMKVKNLTTTGNHVELNRTSQTFD